MKLKIFKPTTPSQRNLIQLNKTDLKKTPLLKAKIKGLKKVLVEVLTDESPLGIKEVAIKNDTDN
jgi:ribosomal protein L2